MCGSTIFRKLLEYCFPKSLPSLIFMLLYQIVVLFLSLFWVWHRHCFNQKQQALP